MILSRTKIEHTQNECIEFCKNLYNSQTNPCNLTLNSLEDDIFNRYYNMPSQWSCLNKLMDDFNKLDICFDYCPLQCDSYYYDISKSVQPILGSGNLNY